MCWLNSELGQDPKTGVVSPAVWTQHVSWGVASLPLTVLPQTWGQMAVFTVYPAECLYQKPVCPGVVVGGGVGCPLSTHPSSWMLRKVSLVGDTLEGLPPGSGSASGTWREISSCPGASAIALMRVSPYISRLDTALHHSLYLFFLPISLALL